MKIKNLVGDFGWNQTLSMRGAGIPGGDVPLAHLKPCHFTNGTSKGGGID